MLHRALGNVRRRVDGVGSRDGVRHSTLVGHVVVLVGRLVMAVPEDGKRALRPSRREARLPQLRRDCWLRWRHAGLRDRVEVVLFLQRTCAALPLGAATALAIILCNQIRNRV